MRILAFDLDGTCLHNHFEISPRNRQALRAAAERGVILLPATGRNFQSAPECILEMPEIRYVMTANGASIYDKEKKEVVYRDRIPNEKARLAQKILDRYHIYTEYYIDGYAYALKEAFMDRFAGFEAPKELVEKFLKQVRFVADFQELLSDPEICPEKVNMVPVPEEIYAQLKEELENLGGLAVTSSFPRNMEYNAKTATKGNTLRVFAENLGVSAGEVMALGDGGNDAGMLRYAGYSFAMQNGTDEVKAAAKYIADDCEADGLGKAVEQYILNPSN